MLTIHGGRKSKKNNTSRRFRGGCGGCVLSPGAYDGGVGTIATGGVPNFQGSPNMPPKSMMVGGGYGFSNGADVATFGGSYAPFQKMCTAGAVDGRGGNNFMSGGARRTKRSSSKRSGSSKSRKSKSKRSRSSKSSKSRKSKSKSKSSRSSKSKKGGAKRSKSSKKWKQIGCQKMRGGILLV
jgi:hypothetical protein